MKKILESQIDSEKNPDKELLERFYGEYRKVRRYRIENSNYSMILDRWEFPRCANFMDPNDIVIAKIKIPDSDSSTIEILEGEITEEESRIALSIFNAVMHGMRYWESMQYYLLSDD